MLETQLQTACDEAVQLSGAIASSIWLWDAERDALQIVAHCHLGPDWVAYGNQVSTTAIAKERAPVYQAYREHVSLTYRAPLQDHRFAYFVEEFADRGFEGIHVLPIQLGQTPIGTLALYFEHFEQANAVSEPTLRWVATQIAAHVTVNGYKNELATRVRELEELNTLLRQQVQHLDRVSRTKTDMFGIVNHELRTPLTAIVGYAEILQKRASQAEDGIASEFLTYIHQSAKRLQALVEDGLTVTLIENGMFSIQPERCDLTELIKQARAALAPRAQEKGVTIRSDGSDTPLLLVCDPKRVTQVLTNLIGNAIKFSPAKRFIDIAVTASEAEVRIGVHDQGIGMAPEVAARVFEKSFQANTSSRRSQEGIGFGLMIAHSIVEAHGGTLEVESELGAGSTFVVTLPRTSERHGMFAYRLRS